MQELIYWFVVLLCMYLCNRCWGHQNSIHLIFLLLLDNLEHYINVIFLFYSFSLFFSCYSWRELNNDLLADGEVFDLYEFIQLCSKNFADFSLSLVWCIMQTFTFGVELCGVLGVMGKKESHVFCLAPPLPALQYVSYWWRRRVGCSVDPPRHVLFYIFRLWSSPSPAYTCRRVTNIELSMVWLGFRLCVVRVFTFDAKVMCLQ